MTPTEFFELFFLCLYWQWDERSLNYCWTTVDKVARLLKELGLLKEKERRALAKDRRVQHLFLRNGFCVAFNSIEVQMKFSHNRGWYADYDKRRENILAMDHLFLINYPITGEINRVRMLRDYRMYLTYKGVAHAKTLEAKWAIKIDRARYLAKCEELELDIPTKAGKATVMSRYRERVDKETEGV